MASNFQNSSAFRMMAYIALVDFTGYSYDWLLSIPGEHQVAARAGLIWPIAIYFLSRITTMGHLLMIVIFTFAPVGHCVPLTAFLAVCAATRAVCTSFLFLLRVRAVYLRSTVVTALFSILWLATVALNLFTYASIRAGPQTGTHFCTGSQVHHTTYPSISSFVFDTLVFVAISYRLAADAATEQSWRARLLSVVTGKGLFSISRVLMTSGQLYYLATVLFFWVNLAVSVSPLVPVSARSSLTTSYMAFTNIMACTVFRGVALGMLENSPTSTGLSSTRIAAAFELASFPADPEGRGDPKAP
ncbi:hypothetical protein FIBSPDRAFT_840687 [Athelia psychrophila]|uniref:G-protein coupled receptors family 1 profile domain-containing protein n=1 Tax=Athelia psychrophila TaxID=1759441 RepID=A0A165WWV0_9AGAM|nr:hypothetical protein FIBSPDRAFT_840687 [Fibularhizoctonia sp. CBS 109695]